jgi:hypothetical protein
MQGPIDSQAPHPLVDSRRVHRSSLAFARAICHSIGLDEIFPHQVHEDVSENRIGSELSLRQCNHDRPLSGR